MLLPTDNYMNIKSFKPIGGSVIFYSTIVELKIFCELIL